jgi:hypothetical protein
MDFDFQTSFANKTNVELLQVVLQKDLFQPAAVAAAQKILASRNVTEEEIAMAKSSIEEKVIIEEKRKERDEKLKSQASNAIYSLLFPAQRTPAYFIRFFCIGFLLLWLIATIPNLRIFYWLWTDSPGLGFIYTAIEVLTLLMLYWLFKLKKSGWFLLMLYFIFQAASSLYTIITFSPPTFLPELQPDLTAHIFRLLFSVLVFYFFNRKDVLETLQVSRRFQKNSILFCIVFLITKYALSLLPHVDLDYYLS